MAKPMPDLIDELSAAATECKELLAEMRAERRALKDLIREAKIVEEELRGAAVDELDKGVAPAVKQMLTEMNEEVQKTINRKHAQVGEFFTRTVNLYLYGNAQGRGINLIEELKRLKEGKG